MNEDLIFQEYSTNRGLQATYPNYESYRDFVMSQQPQQANSNNVGIAPLNSVKSLGKNLIMNKLSGSNPLSMVGGMMFSGLSGLSNRLQQTDFAQAKTLADYYDMQKYGGLQGRTDAAARNMAQARGLQKQMNQRDSAQVSYQDAGRGQMPASNSAPKSAGISAANQGSIDPAGAAGKGRKG